MEYSALLEEMKALPDNERATMKRLVQLVSIGGHINEDYACLLAASDSCSDFFERFYLNDNVRFEYVWAVIANELHPDWLGRFDYLKRLQDVALEGGALVLKSLPGRSDIAIPVPGAPERTDVYIFDDGEVNEQALVPGGVYMGSCELEGERFTGQFSVGFDQQRVIIVLWKYGADGFRVSDTRKVRAC